MFLFWFSDLKSVCVAHRCRRSHALLLRHRRDYRPLPRHGGFARRLGSSARRGGSNGRLPHVRSPVAIAGCCRPCSDRDSSAPRRHHNRLMHGAASAARAVRHGRPAARLGAGIARRSLMSCSSRTPPPSRLHHGRLTHGVVSVAWHTRCGRLTECLVADAARRLRRPSPTSLSSLSTSRVIGLAIRPPVIAPSPLRSRPDQSPVFASAGSREDPPIKQWAAPASPLQAAAPPPRGSSGGYLDLHAAATSPLRAVA